ncbi:hypothetical protein PSACC_01627 [Paramicrosporidium saccamoebae]|uniref:Uncharacterized protein n=1 Tax=Paramicrosporidium saccamoebae TaxID=1246581 RepID=A0A2H9TLF6_9FUNG|nr:hypothetical protein PSACC_01627 [Paramicrosporidium saccamoebae]
MVSIVTEELVATLSPPHDSNLIAGISSRIVAEATDLSEIALERCPENHHKWFQMCAVNLDSLLSPVIERNPIR